MAECTRLVKLFGKTILVPAEAGVSVAPVDEGGRGDAAVLLVVGGLQAEESGKESPGGGEKDGPGTTDGEVLPAKPEEEQNGSASPPEKKAVAKPDMVLPCPRCNSMDTKFCYYNNYNPGQPRHFCRACQRYWTAGGAMRNLPVGAGRRKSKRSAGQNHRHMAFSDAPSIPGIHHLQVLKPDGLLLSFGSNVSPLCNSMALPLNLVEQRVTPCGGAAENGEEHSSGSSVTASNSTEDEFGANPPQVRPQSSQGNLPQATCFGGFPWPPAWSSAPAFPFPLCPTATHWGCSRLAALPSSLSNTGSSTLRKHSREEDVLTESSGERRLWMPKALRIDDPEEVAKSSVWAAMATKAGGGKAVGSSSGGLFMGFDQAKPGARNPVVETPLLLQANPAALARSFNFHESL